jgi:mannose-6-phosphate isomerase-like protein (cupin superfamily)
METRKPKYEKKAWGKEEHIVNNEKYCGKKLHLKEGFRCSIHAHPKEETFYIEKGLVFMELENEDGNGQMESLILKRKDIVHILPNKYHRFSGLKKSVIIEFSTPDTESTRKTQSGAIPDFENWKSSLLEKETPERKGGNKNE